MSKTTVGIRELAERARAEGAIDLAQGVIAIDPPSVLMNNLRSLTLEKNSSYSTKRGVLEYRLAIENRLNKDGWNTVNIDNVQASAGVTGAMTAALLADLSPGDKVLLPEPFFIGHKLLLESLGLEVEYWSVPIDKEPDWTLLEKKMKNVSAVILTSPANPTGFSASMQIIAKLSEAAAENKCLLLVDEMYKDFIWGEYSADQSEYSRINLDNTVVLRGWSKTFAIPGWRVGFAVTSEDRVKAMSVHHDALYLGGSTIAQFALAKTINESWSELQNYVQVLREQLWKNYEKLNEAFIASGMNPLPVVATYYMIIEHGGESDMDVMEELLSKGVMITPVSLFTSQQEPSKYIRAHFAASPEDIERASSALGS